MDLYHEIYLDIIRKLQEEQQLDKVSHDLLEMRKKNQPNSDKIDYVYELLRDQQLLPEAGYLEEEKDDAKSEEFRQVGNSFFSLKAQEYTQAIKAYNRSICYAKSTENLSIGLANRSAVFFELGMFQECLESIRLAREMGYPERLKEKLERREAKCCEELKMCASKKEKYVPTIKLPVNEKIPFLAKCLALREDSQFGRHVVTEQDIAAGTVIAVEEPFCKILADEEKYMRCANCLAEVPHLLLPCNNCTQTMFCSKECQERAHGDFHVFECPISGSLFKILDMSLLVVFRTAIYAFCAFPDTAQIDQELQHIDKEQKNVFSFDWSGEMTPVERYTPIHTLATNEHLRSADYLFKKYTIASLMFHLLKECSLPFAQRFLATREAQQALKNVLFRHSLTGPTNMHSIHVIEDTSNPETPTEFGVAAYGFHSLINHACSPNVTRICVGTGSAVITLKSIAAGEQILDNYGYHHSLMDKEARQKETHRRYQFVCQCRACLENFPMYSALPVPLHVPEPLPLHNQTPAFQYSREFGQKGTGRIVKFIRQYGHLYPILQLCTAEEGLKFCLNILCGNVPLHLRERVRKNAK
ncbi:SET and MYND domain-containing protein 4 [Phlebotomus argentipes]|uniref:SET and MYND domain-containing protein 4 n=1 Tax=Phlebotomus argentipes TaxID=94469 RepID=UPI00289307CC|nr:SET and MYND domain-containing protein 4 [Phlebotomus argentipes]